MSDTSGPFAVPNFSPSDEPDDADFGDDEYDEELDDAEDTENTDDLDASDDAVDDGPAAQVVAAAPVDGGLAQGVLEHIARSIVDEPDAVAVVASSQRDGVRLDLHVASSDMGRIIGRRGRVAQALRSVVRAAAAKDGTDATVDIVD